MTVNALGQRSTTTYDAVGNVTQTTDWAGRATQTSYDNLNRPVTRTDALGGVSTTVYANNLSTVAATDANGRTSTMLYDRAGQMVGSINPLNGRTTTVYDNAGNATQQIDEMGRVTTIAYDDINREIAVVDPLTRRTTTTYDGVGNVTRRTNANGGMVTYVYDAVNQRIAVVNQLSQRVTTVYDAAGNAIASIDTQNRATTTTYDFLNRPETVTRPSGGVETTAYDAAGNVKERINALGNRTTITYDALNRQSTVRDARNSVTSYFYDTAGNLQAVADPNGNRNTFAYDPLNRKTSETDPLGKLTTFAYDIVGNLTGSTDALGRKKEFTRDALDRLTTEVWRNSNGTVNDTRNYQYDAASQLLQAGETTTGTYMMDYDLAGQVTRVVDPSGTTVSFTYDNAGNRTVFRDSLGGIQTSVYDAVNRLTSRTQTGNGGAARVTMTYTTRDQVASVSKYASATGTTIIGSTTFTYDTTGRLTGQTDKRAAAATFRTATYAYDNADRITSQVINSATNTFVYDTTDQLTGDGVKTVTYDANGNRNTNSATIGAGNRVLSDGTWSYTYDDAGNRIRRTGISNGEVWNYQYDFDNHLTYVEARNSANNTLIRGVTFDYDVFGNRIRRVETNSVGTVVAQNRYLYDGWRVNQDAEGNRPSFVGQENWDVWADLDGNNILQTRRMYGAQVDQPLARISAAGITNFYTADRQGSVVGILSDTGTLLDTITYDGYGSVTTESDATKGDRYGYTAREEDVAGTVFLRDRVLSTDTGSFLSRDRMGFAAGDVNLTRYVGNGFSNRTDPSGNYFVVRNLETADRWLEYFSKNYGLTGGQIVSTNERGGSPYFLYFPDMEYKALDLLKDPDKSFDLPLLTSLFSTDYDVVGDSDFTIKWTRSTARKLGQPMDGQAEDLNARQRDFIASFLDGKYGQNRHSPFRKFKDILEAAKKRGQSKNDIAPNLLDATCPTGEGIANRFDNISATNPLGDRLQRLWKGFVNAHMGLMGLPVDLITGKIHKSIYEIMKMSKEERINLFSNLAKAFYEKASTGDAEFYGTILYFLATFGVAKTLPRYPKFPTEIPKSKQTFPDLESWLESLGLKLKKKGGPAPETSTSRNAIEKFADSLQGLLGKQRPTSVARLDGPAGEFFGQSQKGIAPLTHHPVVEGLLKRIPADPAAPGQWGRCGEVDAINQALRAYETRTGTKITTLEQARKVLKGSKIQTAEVRGPGGTPGVHGGPKIPCTVCNPLLKELGVIYE